MSLTIQTIEELEKLAKEEPFGLDEDYCAADNGNYDDTFQDGYEAGQVDLARSLTSILSAARWALERGYTDSLKEEESCPSPKNPCFCSCHPEKECLDCLCGRHKPNSSSQDGCKG